MSRLLLTLGLVSCIAAPAAHAEEFTPEEKHAITMAFLEGNPEHAARYEPRDEGADAWLPTLLYEYWWRPVPRKEARILPDVFLRDGARKAKGLTGRRVAWIAAPHPKPPYPMPKAGESDPWPVLSALVQDRWIREAQGLEGVMRENPLGTLAAAFRKRQVAGTLSENEAHQLWWVDLARNDFSYSYQGDPPTAEQREALETGRAIADRNLIVALLALLLLIAAPIVVGLRAGRAGTASA